MTVVSVAQALAGKFPEGGEVTVRGWVRTVRGSAALAFVNVSDGSGFAPIQAVVADGLSNFDEVKRLTPGCSVIVTGTLVASQGKGQSYEIQASAVEVIGWVGVGIVLALFAAMVLQIVAAVKLRDGARWARVLLTISAVIALLTALYDITLWSAWVLLVANIVALVLAYSDSADAYLHAQRVGAASQTVNA